MKGFLFGLGVIGVGVLLLLLAPPLWGVIVIGIGGAIVCLYPKPN